MSELSQGPVPVGILVRFALLAVGVVLLVRAARRWRGVRILVTGLLAAVAGIALLVTVKEGWGWRSDSGGEVTRGALILACVGVIAWVYRGRPRPAAAAPAVPAPPSSPAPDPRSRGRAFAVVLGFAAVAMFFYLVRYTAVAPRMEGGWIAFVVLLIAACGAGIVWLLAAPAPRPPAARRADRPGVSPVWLACGVAAGLAVVVVILGTTRATGEGPGVMVLPALLVVGLVVVGAGVALAVGRKAPDAPPDDVPDGGDKPRRSPEPVVAPPRGCPKCGAAIAADAPQGLCPKCLLQGAFAAAVSPLQTAAYAGPYVPPPVEDVASFFPQLEVLDLVGQGGMGAVYKARQPNLDRVVALKLIRPNDDDPTFAERFGREAKALARLSHPNIVAVYEFGEAGGSQYLLMEFVDGVTLREAMRAKSLTPAVALKVIGQICDALQFAHDKGVVHRDIKPENILLAKDGTVKIADFGLAKVVDPDGLTLTRTHQAMGTPHYMAPEQWEKPAEVDHRADIYALGVVFYELLTGELPLGRFDPPSQKVRVDVRIDEVVLRALAKEPGRRYQAVVELRTDVDHIGRSPYRSAAWCGSPVTRLREYKSQTTVFGWPLVHIVNGVDPITGRQPWAKGVIAIGGKAIGGLAIGGVAVGGVALGGCGIGVFALAGCAVGGVAVGGFALALVAAFGGMAVAGLFAGGGNAIGYFAAGGNAVGAHTLDGMTQDPTAFWQSLKDFFTAPTAPPAVAPPEVG